MSQKIFEISDTNNQENIEKQLFYSITKVNWKHI